jgi:hypothetical protein
MSGTNQTLISMGADVNLMATNGFIAAVGFNLLVMVKRGPRRKRKHKYPKHSYG